MKVRAYARAQGKLSTGTWQLRTPTEVTSAIWSCGECSASTLLGAGSDYRIDNDGRVSPAVACDCGDVVFVRLSGWMDRKPLPDY